jgi:hypothetical protein
MWAVWSTIRCLLVAVFVVVVVTIWLLVDTK